jgi:TPP-dependent 2-oxoacid decarboxylase
MLNTYMTLTMNAYYLARLEMLQVRSIYLTVLAGDYSYDVLDPASKAYDVALENFLTLAELHSDYG